MQRSSDTTQRGKTKTKTLMVMGDESAVIHPQFLHVTPNGYLQGLAIDRQRHARTFTMTLADFHKIRLNVVKGCS